MYRSVIALACVSILGAGTFAGSTQVQQRTVYVTAVDKQGVPVTGLRPQDLTVTEDAHVRQIVSVELAKPIPKIAVILNDRGDWNMPLRQSLRSFLLAARGKAEVGLFTPARSEWTIADFTSDTESLVDIADKQVAVTRDTDHLETLMESLARRFGKDEVKRPIIVLLNQGPPVTSVSPRWDIVVREILKSQTKVFAVGVGMGQLIETAAEDSGGRVDLLMTSMGLPSAVSRLQDEIFGQYAVTYESTKAPGDGLRLKIKPTRSDIAVRGPERVY